MTPSSARALISWEGGHPEQLAVHVVVVLAIAGTSPTNEVVLVLFDPKRISYDGLLKSFWESHDPTQGMRQGDDVGTQYRSGIYVYSPEQRRQAEASRDAYQRVLVKAGVGPITTEIVDASEFYYAEDYHQQYLAKNPSGYCGLDGTGVACPTGLVEAGAAARPSAPGRFLTPLQLRS